MHTSRLRPVLALLSLAAALALSAPAARAQETVLRARALRGAPPRLYDAIAQLRPGWLQVGADSTGIAQVAVYVNGRYLGDGRLLRTLDTERVTSARLRSADFVRASDLPLPRGTFAFAIEVNTRPVGRTAPPSQVTLSLDGGVDPWPLAHGVRVALEDAGYHRQELSDGTRFEDVSKLAPSVGASAHYAASAPWGVALTVQHTFRTVGGGYSPQGDEAVSAAVTTTEAAAMATRDAGAVRVGIGPVLRRGDWEWARGFCRCTDARAEVRYETGVAGEARIALPYGSRVFPAVRMMARYYPSWRSEYPVLDEQVDVGGFVVTTSLGIATRF